MLEVKMVKSDWFCNELSPREYRAVAPSFLSKYLFGKFAERKSARIAWFVARLFGAYNESRNRLVAENGSSSTVDAVAGVGGVSMVDDASFVVAERNR